VKIRSFALAAALALGSVSFAAPALAQSDSGYVGGTGTWKSGTGLCWRTSYWAPSMASAECDPDLMPKPAPVAPRAAPTPPPPPPPPAPVAKPAPPKPRALNVTLTETFPTGKATLTPAMRAKLDSDVIAKLPEFASIDSVRVEGHTDRLGSNTANQALSERRANAVATYLAEKGVPPSKIDTLGWGQIYPVKSCPDQKNRKALADCLAPNRRVTVEVSGMPK